MVVAAVIQHYIYVNAPCGNEATNGECIAELGPPDMSLWSQTPAYVLIAFFRDICIHHIARVRFHESAQKHALLCDELVLVHKRLLECYCTGAVHVALYVSRLY
ncbi:hypothetical protein A1O7_06248 [Cladophialophora yegresii CBS 114405]|uniref:Uncharacterized protein n=1 Tax=Cladophialophora yegresii CBS 114405 TaxID=1182544 RepID=W9VTC1_9EURO|nr:uncharacterized protein A1O7_06248 [Cladophialophora yegresii CBS 114405]EXJ58818.1 hypothetical protein A1O7_06248 [Cladophialophora yegresii CBS 114405]